MSNIKNRITKLEKTTMPTIDKFINEIGLPTFKAMLDYLQDFVTEAKAAPRVGNKIDINFTPPEELRGYFLRWGRITGSEVFKKMLNSGQSNSTF